MASINGVFGRGHAIEIRTSRGIRGRFGTLRLTAADASRLLAMSEDKETLVYSGPLLSRGARRVEKFAVEIVEIARYSPMHALIQFQERGPLAAEPFLTLVPH